MEEYLAKHGVKILNEYPIMFGLIRNVVEAVNAEQR